MRKDLVGSNGDRTYHPCRGKGSVAKIRSVLWLNKYKYQNKYHNSRQTDCAVCWVPCTASGLLKRRSTSSLCAARCMVPPTSPLEKRPPRWAPWLPCVVTTILLARIVVTGIALPKVLISI